MSLILIDVGGTTINLSVFENHLGSDNLICVKNKKYDSRRTWKDLNVFLEIILEKYSYKNFSLIIGLPGPINPWNSEIFFPPLGFKFNIKEFQLKEKFKTLFIYNDLVPFLIKTYSNYIKNKNLKYFQRASLSIGTSLGHGHIQLLNNNQMFLQTYESAHQSISNITRSHFDKFSINKRIERRNDLLSCQFLLKDIFISEGKEPLNFSKNYEIRKSFSYYDVLDWVAIELIEILKIHSSFLKIDLYGGFKNFLVEHPILFDYLERKISYFSENNFILERNIEKNDLFPKIHSIENDFISNSIIKIF